MVYSLTTPCECLLPVFLPCFCNVHLHEVSLAGVSIPKTHKVLLAAVGVCISALVYELARLYWLAVDAILGPLPYVDLCCT